MTCFYGDKNKVLKNQMPTFYPVIPEIHLSGNTLLIEVILSYALQGSEYVDLHIQYLAKF